MSRVALFLLTWPFWLVGVPWTCLLRFSALKRVTTLQIYPTVCSEIHILLLCMGGIYYCISSNNVFMAAAFPPSLSCACLHSTHCMMRVFFQSMLVMGTSKEYSLLLNMARWIFSSGICGMTFFANQINFKSVFLPSIWGNYTYFFPVDQISWWLDLRRNLILSW